MKMIPFNGRTAIRPKLNKMTKYEVTVEGDEGAQQNLITGTKRQMRKMKRLPFKSVKGCSALQAGFGQRYPNNGFWEVFEDPEASTTIKQKVAQGEGTSL